MGLALLGKREVETDIFITRESNSHWSDVDSCAAYIVILDDETGKPRRKKIS